MAVEKVGNSEALQLEEINFDDQKIALNPIDLKKSKRRVYKNVIVIGLSWIFLFTAYGSIANLQSSLNTDAGLGTIGLSVTYVGFIISCLLLPTVMINKLGIKWTIFISQLAYILYIGLNIYPRYYTLIPSAILLGSGPLWTAQSTFLTDLGSYYSKLTGEKPEIVINRFFGIFYAMFQSSQIWGNIIISTVLKSKKKIDDPIKNISRCGKNDNPTILNETLIKPSQISIYILCGILIICAIIGLGLIFFLIDKYKKIGLYDSKQQEKPPIKLILNTFKNMKNMNQVLLIPLTAWLGFQQGFLLADFTKSFISCILGVESVGIVLIVYGIFSTIGSYWFGYMVKLVGRQVSFGLAAFLSYVIILLLICWEPTIENIYILYISAIIWGVTDAAQSVGYAVSFAYSNFIGTNIKLNLLLIYLTIGMIGYGLVEKRIKKQKPESEVPSS